MMLQTPVAWNKTLLKKAGIRKKSVKNLENDLMAFLGEFAACFPRREGLENCSIMIKGLFSDLERKSIEPIALRYGNAKKVRSLQTHMSSPNSVYDKALLRAYQKKWRCQYPKTMA